MIFSSTLFLFRFLPAFLTVYHLVPGWTRNFVALLASLLFYAWGAPLFVYVLLASTAVDYVLAQRIAAAAAPQRRRRYLQLSLFVNLALLVWFKYANFCVEQIDALLAVFGCGSIPWTRVALPIGISFFTFHKISYVVDVYRGAAEPARNFGDCLLYFVLFPQLIAGPIIRYHDIAEQVRARTHTTARFWHGVQRFSIGLAKKVLIANGMASIVDTVYAQPIHAMPTAYAWLAALAYYFQIYFDFSGYSDMAIGLGRMMGFEFLENFERPYTAKTFTEFWRRWHISLSNFMREYVYIPLGGNRVSPVRGYVNLWIVFLVSGFWHGASWNFVVWGAYQGVFLTLDKLGWAKIAARLPGLLLRPLMVLLVVVSWVVFRADTLTAAMQILGRMFTGGGPHPGDTGLTTKMNIDTYLACLFTVAATISFLPWSQRYLALEQACLRWARSGAGAVVAGVLVMALFVFAAIGVVNSAYNPFIYYRF